MKKCRKTVEATSFSLRPLVLIGDDDFHHAALRIGTLGLLHDMAANAGGDGVRSDSARNSDRPRPIVLQVTNFLFLRSSIIPFSYSCHYLPIPLPDHRDARKWSVLWDYFCVREISSDGCTGQPGHKPDSCSAGSFLCMINHVREVEESAGSNPSRLVRQLESLIFRATAHLQDYQSRSNAAVRKMMLPSTKHGLYHIVV